jgi:selenide,water dikinase
MAEGSGATIVFEESDLPLLPDALDLCRAGMIPGGGARNREYYGPKVRISDEIADEMAELAFDPQTSGGLLVAAEIPGAPVIGELVARGERTIVVR